MKDMARSAAFEAIIRGSDIKKPNLPASFNVLVSELKALGLNVAYELEEEGYSFVDEHTPKRRKERRNESGDEE